MGQMPRRSTVQLHLQRKRPFLFRSRVLAPRSFLAAVIVARENLSRSAAADSEPPRDGGKMKAARELRRRAKKTPWGKRVTRPAASRDRRPESRRFCGSHRKMAS